MYSNMPKAPQRDYSIEHITDCVISNIIVLSEVGSDFRDVSVQVAKEILRRYGEGQENEVY